MAERDAGAVSLLLAGGARLLAEFCRRGGIGRHTILRGWRRKPCEFESHRRHQNA